MPKRAKHVVIYFCVGQAEHRTRVRLVVGFGQFEMLENCVDALGESTERWHVVGFNGLPSIDRVLARALRVSYSDLPPRSPADSRLYPDGVHAVGENIEIGPMTS